MHAHIINLDNESHERRKHLYDIVFPFVKSNELLNTILIGVLTELKNSNYVNTNSWYFVIISLEQKGKNIHDSPSHF